MILDLKKIQVCALNQHDYKEAYTVLCTLFDDTKVCVYSCVYVSFFITNGKYV